MKTIDMSGWERRERYEFFSRIDNPIYGVTFTLYVTSLRSYAKRRGLSFYYLLVYASMAAANRIDNFRYRIRGGDVVLLDRVEPSYTDLPPESEQFHITIHSTDCTMEEFCRCARYLRTAQQEFLPPFDGEPDSLVYISCLPWFDMTAATNERNFDRDDSIPRLIWGGYYRDGDRLKLHYSVKVNHRLVDGVHIGRFYRLLPDFIDALE